MKSSQECRQSRCTGVCSDAGYLFRLYCACAQTLVDWQSLVAGATQHTIVKPRAHTSERFGLEPLQNLAIFSAR